MSFSLIVLILVFLGIALRQTLRIPVRNWHIMSGGALLVIATGQISLSGSYAAIDWNIILFLFGVFALGEALDQSGFLSHIAPKLGKSNARLFASIIFGMGILSAFLMNDTLAIIGTPLLLRLAHERRINPTPLLLALAFSITIGSIMSPIGNPQNLFIAIQGNMEAPFATFFTHLAVPTLINLALLYLIFLFIPLKKRSHDVEPKPAINAPLLRICKGALLIFAGIIITSLFMPIPLPWIALIPAIILFLFAKQRHKIFRRLDWPTIIFFVAMFILMESVWQMSSLKHVISDYHATSPGPIMLLGVLASQLISNVPFVALYLPTLQATTDQLMALAAGSSLAGNLLIFGAASNMIIIQNAERRKESGLTFFTFAKFGIPITALNLAVYWLFSYIS